MRKKSHIVIVISLSLIFGITIAGSLAFLTSKTETEANSFTVGEIAIELKEPMWSAQTDTNKNGIPDKAENLSPAETVVKDPKVTNTGINSTYVYLRVRVPKEPVAYVDQNGKVVRADSDKPIELFSYAVNNGWTEFMKDENNKYTDYYYYYDEVLAPSDTSVTLFDQVVFADAIEGQLEDERYMVDVTAYGIQSSDNNNVLQAWNQLAKEKHMLVCEGETV